MSPNDAEGIANNVDPDQSSLIWVCTICPGISVRKLNTVQLLELAQNIYKGYIATFLTWKSLS